jgi:hypothetical protein
MLQESFKQAKRAGVPLLMVETPDPAAAQMVIVESMNGKAEQTPILKWDLIQGILPVNEVAVDVASAINDGQEASMITANPVEALRKLEKLPEGGILLMYGSEKIVDVKEVRQAIWNLRDPFKSEGKMLVLLAPLGTKLTGDIKDDIVVIEHALPDEIKLAAVAKSIVSDAKLKPMSDEVKAKVIDATIGLSEFSAEQVIAMSITKEGIDTSALWERKRKAIEQTAGLSVYKGEDKFADIGGCGNAKKFYGALIGGKRAPRCVVFVDEIEKAMGSQQDTSGTSQEMLGIMLRWMQDKAVSGCILVGVAGSGKSAISKAIGNEANIPTIEFDLTAMKGSLVGESGARLRSAIATVDAIGQGRTMVIATCNSISNLPPELRRRFTLGTFFFDLPTVEEREMIWKIYLKKYSLTGKRPDDDGWTGAEIKQCCDVADRLGISLIDAAKYVVPVSKSAAEVIENLRQSASGRFISASYDGEYRYNKQTKLPTGTQGRKFGND